MEQSSKAPPQATEIYFASLVATGLVYLAGVLIYTAIVFVGGNLDNVTGILMVLFGFLTMGVIFAAFAGLAVVGPLGTGFGLLVLKVTKAGWWQGPLVGALVTVTLEAFVVFVVSREELYWEWGNAVMLTWPVILAMIAGWYVQRRVLKWPNGADES